MAIQPPGAAGGAPQPPKTVSHVLGEITWLLGQSPLHNHLSIKDLEWMVMPALLLEQFRIFPAPDGQPAGLILWASVSEETEQRLMREPIRLVPQDWNSGDRRWLIEMVAPFGGQEEMLADAARTIFAGRSFKYHRPGPQGPQVITHDPTG